MNLLLGDLQVDKRGLRAVNRPVVVFRVSLVGVDRSGEQRVRIRERGGIAWVAIDGRQDVRDDISGVRLVVVVVGERKRAPADVLSSREVFSRPLWNDPSCHGHLLKLARELA